MLSTSNQNTFTKLNLTAIIVLRALNYLDKCWMLSQKYTWSFHEFPIYISNTNLIIVTGILPSLDNFLCRLVDECDRFDGNSACHRQKRTEGGRQHCVPGPFPGLTASGSRRLSLPIIHSFISCQYSFSFLMHITWCL